MADRIEREIEEILRKIDDFVPERPRRRRARPGRSLAAAPSWLFRRLARISLGQIMMWAILVFLIAFFARGVPIATWVMVGAIVVFITAFLLSRSAGTRRPSIEKRWRGQPLDLSGPTLPERMKAWWKARKHSK